MIDPTIQKYADTIAERASSASTQDKEKFLKAMTRQHRTHQQSFTRLCVLWLTHVGQDEYLTDGRNENSHQVGNQFVRCVNDELIDPYLPMV